MGVDGFGVLFSCVLFNATMYLSLYIADCVIFVHVGCAVFWCVCVWIKSSLQSCGAWDAELQLS